MTLASAAVRAAKALIAADKKARLKARPPRVAPVSGIGQREPRKRDPRYLQWLRRAVCVAGASGRSEMACSGSMHAAHLRMGGQGRRNPGLGAKPDDRLATPLCEAHHLHDQHKGSEGAFWAGLRIDPGALTKALSAAYDAGLEPSRAVSLFLENQP